MPGKSTRLALVFVSRPSKCSPIILSLALLGCVLGSGIARGQATTSVRGTVADPNGNAVVGANVVIANAESRTERAATTGDQGEYQFLLIPPGTYRFSLQISYVGRFGRNLLTQRDLTQPLNIVDPTPHDLLGFSGCGVR